VRHCAGPPRSTPGYRPRGRPLQSGLGDGSLRRLDRLVATDEEPEEHETDRELGRQQAAERAVGHDLARSQVEAERTDAPSQLDEKLLELGHSHGIGPARLAAEELLGGGLAPLAVLLGQARQRVVVLAVGARADRLEVDPLPPGLQGFLQACAGPAVFR
jgi:hypothetical protein